MASDGGTVLIAYDGSRDAATAIRRAGELLAPRRAVVVYVRDSLAALLLHPELDETVAAAAGQTAAEGAGLAAAAGLEARAVAIEAGGPVWAALRDSADAHSSSVIVIGTRGRGPIAAGVLGSVSSAMIHHADVPVLVVPPAEA